MNKETLLDFARPIFGDLNADVSVASPAGEDILEVRVSPRAFDYHCVVRWHDGKSMGNLRFELEGARELLIEMIFSGVAAYKSGYPKVGEVA